MAQNTRTVLLWFDNDAERLTFSVNPQQIDIRRPQVSKTFHTITGEALHAAGGLGLTEVDFSTFLPAENSRFYAGLTPVEALQMLRRWQGSFRPVRLIISDSGINDAFLITEMTQTLREGDGDIGLSLRLREYKFSTVQSLSEPAVPASGLQLQLRPDERTDTRTHTVRAGDTLWAIAVRYYRDGTRWHEIAAQNGIADPQQLPIGKVLTL